MTRIHCRRRGGFTLLELVVTTTLVGITITAVAALLRSSTATWDAYDSDHSRLDAAHSVVRHMIRGLRQADRVTAITPSATTTGSLAVVTVDGAAASWSMSSGRVYYNLGGTANLIAENVNELSFVGLRADGLTPTTVVSEIRSVRITLTVQLDRDANSSRLVRCTAWLRVKT